MKIFILIHKRHSFTSSSSGSVPKRPNSKLRFYYILKLIFGTSSFVYPLKKI